MLESELLSNIREYLQYMENLGNLFSLRLNSGMAYLPGAGGKKYAIQLCPAGTSDLLVIADGKVYFLETKTGTEQSIAQMEFQQKVEEQGCVYKIIRDLQEVVDLFK